MDHKGSVGGGCGYLCGMIRPIVAYGDPVLKKEAREVEPQHPDLSALIADMWETMYEADGVGLAAPQIGLSLRMFVADGSPFGEGEEGDPGCKKFKRVMINPVLFDMSEEEESMEEGCLSIPGIREPVNRPVRIGVEYYDEEWNLVEEHLEGLAARIVQHENDHLDGKMIPDHIPVAKRMLLHGKLRDIGLGKVPVDYKMRFPKTKKRG
jgi:peptide deformylase